MRYLELLKSHIIKMTLHKNTIKIINHKVKIMPSFQGLANEKNTIAKTIFSGFLPEIIKNAKSNITNNKDELEKITIILMFSAENKTIKKSM